MSSTISGIRLKIARANKHIGDLEAGIKSFNKTNPCGVDSDDDPNTGDRVFTFRSTSKIPDDFSLIAGDAIHNLRSVLDHLAWQLVLANQNAPTSITCYPIAETVQKYTSGRTAKTKGMNDSAKKLIDATNPYAGGTDALWTLHKLDIFDKHCLMVVCGTAHWHTNRGGGSSIYPANRIPAGDGTEIYRIRRDDRPKIDENIQFTFEIAFLDPPIVQGEAILKTLYDLSDLVEGIVTQFEPLL